jgi:radical SAM protein with 4Fe4S-binding SPASM domain
MFVQFKHLRGYNQFLPSKYQFYNKLNELYENIKSRNLESFFNQNSNLLKMDQQFFINDTTTKIPNVDKCYYSLLYLLIRVSGDVYPCGLMSFKKKNIIGNIYKNNISYIIEKLYYFFNQNNPSKNLDCIGCWDNHINNFFKNNFENNLYFKPEEIFFPFPFSRFWF